LSEKGGKRGVDDNFSRKEVCTGSRGCVPERRVKKGGTGMVLGGNNTRPMGNSFKDWGRREAEKTAHCGQLEGEKKKRNADLTSNKKLRR